MATSVNKQVELELMNGEEITVTPLSVYHLKKFATKLEDFEDMQEAGELAFLDYMVELALFVLDAEDIGVIPEFEDIEDDDERAERRVEELSKVVDMPTCNRISMVAQGVVDPEGNQLMTALSGVS